MNRINWDLIKPRWESGETSTALAKELPVTRQAVDKRAKKEGWQRKSKDSPMNWFEKAQDTYIVASGSSDKRNPETIAAVLDNVSRGVPQGIAAKAAGISPGTLTNWKREDEELVRLISMAGNQALAKSVLRINRAGERGDWKADKWLLENHPEAAQEYGQKSKGDGGTLNIQFKFERKIPGVTIDAEPEEPLALENDEALDKE